MECKAVGNLDSPKEWFKERKIRTNGDVNMEKGD